MGGMQENGGGGGDGGGGGGGVNRERIGINGRCERAVRGRLNRLRNPDPNSRFQHRAPAQLTPKLSVAAQTRRRFFAVAAV